MKVVSKFLTGDVRVTAVESTVETLKISGLIKETFPIEIELESSDFRDMIPLLAQPAPLLSVFRLSTVGFLRLWQRDNLSEIGKTGQ